MRKYAQPKNPWNDVGEMNQSVPDDSVSEFMGVTDEQLSEWIDHKEESLAEIDAENASETALFGDSGPGSAVGLGEQRAWLRRAKKELARRRPSPPAKPDFDFGEFPPGATDDVPF